ncbi:MAG: DUF937 domain-containing protein [Acidobacteriota bacterium]|nr:DUF937 domain-containing protein [Acidobacteriota bacterium]
MFSLQDLLGNQQGSEAVEQISRDVGAEPGAVNSAIQMALPAILGGLAKNAADAQGAQSLDNALERDHDGSILDNLGGLGNLIFGGGREPERQSSPSRQTDAGGILGHVFGNNQGQVAEQISQRSGLSSGQVAQILMLLAPIVMGYLGRQKREQNLDAGGLSNWLGGQQQQIQNAPQGGFLNSMLDRDGDGSSMDDIASMAMNYMTNRR